MGARDEGSAAVERGTRAISEGLVSFELVLYASVGVLLGVAGVLIIVGTVSGLVRGIVITPERLKSQCSCSTASCWH